MKPAAVVALCLVVSLAAVYSPLSASRARLVAQGRAAAQAPVFEVDPFWPKPLPNHWVTGSTIGLSVDAQDNVWTIHRPNTVDDNFRAADIMVGDARGRDDEAQPGAGARASRRPRQPRSAIAARSRRRFLSTTRRAIW